MTTFNELGSKSFKIERVERPIPGVPDTLDLSGMGSETIVFQLDKLDELIDLLTKARELFGLENKRVNLTELSNPDWSKTLNLGTATAPTGRFDGGCTIYGPSGS